MWEEFPFIWQFIEVPSFLLKSIGLKQTSFYLCHINLYHILLDEA
jgi:hypothetical protein